MSATWLDGEAAGWVRAWDAQQAAYVPERDAVLGFALDVVEQLGAAPGRLVDLGCGPGAFAGRAAARWPGARVVGVDLDPVLLALGRATLPGAVDWAEIDLRRPDAADLVAERAGGQLDAVVSATALHWLSPPQLRALVSGLARHMRRGAVFADFDTLRLDPRMVRLRALTERVREDGHRAALESAPGVHDWEGWWAALRAEGGLDAEFAERDRRFADRERGPGATLDELVGALRDAGFAEVAPLRQLGSRQLVVAVR